MLLSDEVLESIFEKSHRDNGRKEIFREIAKAQVERFVEWGDEDCPHSHTIPVIPEYATRVYLQKRACEKCWQALLDEVK